MNIGLIVHSHSGNTKSVAQTMLQALEAAGHSVSLQPVNAENEDPKKRSPLKLASNPE